MDAVVWALVFVMVLLGVPWVLALWMLWQARPARELWHASDGPGRLLALAMAALPEHRGDWGLAMTAELDLLRSRAERWWFALGGLRVALFPPGPNRRLTLGSSAAVILVAAGVQGVVGNALPGMRVFAVTLVVLVGAVVTLSAARSGRFPLGGAGVTLTATVPAAVVGAIGMAVYFLRTHPSADQAVGPGSEALLAVVLSLLCCLVVAPPRVLVARRLPVAFGIGGGLALGLLLGSAALLGNDGGGVFNFMIFGPMLVAGTCGALASAFGGTFHSGVQAAVWTVAVGAPLSFIVGVLAAIYTFEAEQGMLFDGEVGLSIGTNLPDLIQYASWILLTGLPYGVIGAALGASLLRRRPATS